MSDVSGESPQTLELRLANRRITVPIIGDESTTRLAADHVNRALTEIEAKAERVDTQVFALLAALQFASQALELTSQRTEESHELVKALDGIASALRALAEDLSEEE